MRKNKLFKNTFSSLLYQMVAIVCGFILPRAILSFYGSEINGLVNSITQFLAIFSFMDMGVGAVVQSALYRPLVEKNNEEISNVVTSASRFFKRVALILLVYILGLVVLYPQIANQNFDVLFCAELIVVMGISSFAQYYLGAVDQLILQADQKGYIQYYLQAASVLINTAVCTALIYLNFSIVFVKLATSLIYVARPLIVRAYVNRHYNLNRHAQYKNEPIVQKWNGMAQHVSAVVLQSTDSIVLTMFASLSDVSVYAVYHLVVNGVKGITISLMNGLQPYFGAIIAKGDKEKLFRSFSLADWSIHTVVTYVFGCAATLILPFVEVYTNGITDAVYYRVAFSLLIVVAYAMYCIRSPYHLLIKAAGHYQQTQRVHVIGTLLNIVISVMVVKAWGLVGVAIGTLAAMTYQTVWMAFYISKNIVFWPIIRFFKQLATDIAGFVLIVLIGNLLKMSGVSYAAWIVLAIKICLIAALIEVTINAIFYPKNLGLIIHKKIMRKVKK